MSPERSSQCSIAWPSTWLPRLDIHRWHVSGTPSARCGTLAASDHAAGARGGPDGHRRRPRHPPPADHLRLDRDRKSTRLNSSHEWISYAVFCLKKKKKTYDSFSLIKKKNKITNKQNNSTST